MTLKYSVNIVWSDEDQTYLASVPELPGCVADGLTQEQAVSNLRTIVNEWLEVASADGRRIPRPRMAARELMGVYRKHGLIR